MSKPIDELPGYRDILRKWKDTDRLIKFLHEQSDETDSDGIAQWFTAAANKLQTLRDRVQFLESR